MRESFEMRRRIQSQTSFTSRLKMNSRRELMVPVTFCLRMSDITGLNHLTLAVRDLDRSVAFYSELLGFSLHWRGPASAYLEAGTFWLALVVDEQTRSTPLPEYTHAAFTVAASTLPLLAGKLARAGSVSWQKAETPDSFYFLDPDGHKLELHSGDLRGRLKSRTAPPL
jgi:catechol 2,3-dioxygenase-like lactoylglutathione lyase family enzyme